MKRKRSSLTPLAIAGACLGSIAPPAAASELPARTARVAAPVLHGATKPDAGWVCSASARFRGRSIGTSWSSGASSRERAASQALTSCSNHAGGRQCSLRRCWQE